MVLVVRILSPWPYNDKEYYKNPNDKPGFVIEKTSFRLLLRCNCSQKFFSSYYMNRHLNEYAFMRQILSVFFLLVICLTIAGCTTTNVNERINTMNENSLTICIIQRVISLSNIPAISLDGDRTNIETRYKEKVAKIVL